MNDLPESVDIERLTPAALQKMKAAGQKIAALTAYDYPTARLLDEAGVDFLLVGDSLGMVVLGLPDTTGVTLADILHHTRPVARAARRALIVADLPFGTYDTPEAAVPAARQLVAAGAQAVKLEGPHTGQIAALVGAGIPAMAHLGMLPQHILEEGRYNVKGKTEEDAARLLAEALAVEGAGACAVVLELVRPPVAAEISRQLRIPTIGIGAGADCDGQILVTHDLIGLFPWFTPRFVQPKASVGAAIRAAGLEFVQHLRGGAAC